jgi:hypothetical protein
MRVLLAGSCHEREIDEAVVPITWRSIGGNNEDARGVKPLPMGTFLIGPLHPSVGHTLKGSRPTFALGVEERTDGEAVTIAEALSLPPAPEQVIV